MSTYTSEVYWEGNDQAFTDKRFSRKHVWRFDGGIEVPGSASPHVLSLPLTVNEAVDPEEPFVVSLSSCHMLWFLSLPAQRGFVVDSHKDKATGWMEKNAAGKLAMTKVVLYPAAKFSRTKLPSRAEVEELHHQAHEECLIASSVRTDVRCEPIFEKT
jgi:organic hydroperoxide reductase OsmC/OhrA